MPLRPLWLRSVKVWLTSGMGVAKIPDRCG